MAVFELFDETLDINSTENYDLSVEISDSSLSYAILDSLRNKYILLRSFTNDEKRKIQSGHIEEFIEKDDFLRKKYRKTRIVIASEKSTLVPAALYDPGMKDEYFRFNHLMSENSSVMANRLKIPDAYLLFDVNEHITGILNSYFPGSVPCHHLKTLIEIPVNPLSHFHGSNLLLWVGSEFISVLVFEEGNPLFINSFRHRNTSDILYFLGNIFTALSLKRETPVHLSGMLEIYDETWTALSAYFPVTGFLKPTGSAGYSYVFNDLRLHKFINLFTLSACE